MNQNIQFLSSAQEVLAETAAYLEKEPEKIEPFSPEYIFGKKYAAHRSARLHVQLGSTQFHSRLSILLRELMSEQQRDRVFCGVFDLGNMKQVPAEICNYEKLADECYARRTEDGVVSKDAFQTIKERILCITGKSMEEHAAINKSTAFKVIRTLDRLMMDRGEKSTMKLFDVPTDKRYSLSFRGSHPYAGNKEQTWLISDMKEYLSVELSNEQVKEIENAFSGLLDEVNLIRSKVETRLGVLPKNLMVSKFKLLTELIENFDFDKSSNDIPLDLTLTIHLHRLEFEHFAFSFPKLIELAKPNCLIKPINSQIQRFAAAISEPKQIKDHEPLVPLAEVPKFLFGWRFAFIDLIKEATGFEVTIKEFESLIPTIQDLLRIFLTFRGLPQHAFNERFLVASLWNCISASCCVVYMKRERPLYRPYWVGQQRQSGSIYASVQVPLHEINLELDSVPEEHRQIAVNYFEWFADSIRGSLDIRIARNSFFCTLLRIASEISRINDVQKMTNAFSELQKYIDYFLDQK